MIAPVSSPRQSQRGVTLIIGLILLVLITLVVTSAFTLSGSNLRSVGNMQVRDEAIAAANTAIEIGIESSFAASLSSATRNIDINNDGETDYVVSVAAPTCVRASNAIKESYSSVTLGAGMSSSAYWNTIWDFDATVTDTKTGASTRVHQGVRVLIPGSSADVSGTYTTARTQCGIS